MEVSPRPALQALANACRYFAEGYFDPLPVMAGIVQTVLYADFFYIYWTKIMQGQKFNLPV